ncbi:hypothetical protein [uncultured Nostoc sp.]|uniref:hypothetical protein n=1 Tax=uncultured Nostoc sp. TaxID=340711 RepID=UPI0035C9C9C7
MSNDKPQATLQTTSAIAPSTSHISSKNLASAKLEEAMPFAERLVEKAASYAPASTCNNYCGYLSTRYPCTSTLAFSLAYAL